MKAITICQPFAHLICLPDDDPEAKRVENRTWTTDYRGPIAIHAGKSRVWLEDGDEEKYPGMVYGAVVAIAQLRFCFLYEEVARGGDSYVLRRWPWLAHHQHVEGPCCWLLAEVRPLAEPIPYRGAQGLFEIPDRDLEVIRDATAAR
jgi:hypothetical protein